MKVYPYFVHVLLRFAAVFIAYQTANALNISTLTVSETKTYLQKEITTNGGCKTNFCFALQSSASVGKNNFNLQKQFLLHLIDILLVDKTVQVSAVQYGTIASTIEYIVPISTAFKESVQSAPFDGQDDTSVSAAIVACEAHFTVKQTPDKLIVVFGDGQNNFGGNPRFNAQLFKDDGGRLFGIAVQESAKQELATLLDLNSGYVVGITKKYWQIKWGLAAVVSKVCI